MSTLNMLLKKTFKTILICCFLVTAGTTISFAQSTSWTGKASTAWNTAANWTAGVPTAAVDAIIGDRNFRGIHQPEVHTKAICKNLTIAGKVSSRLTAFNSLTINANLTINSNGILDQRSCTITVLGNMSGKGTYTASSNGSLLVFAGTSPSPSTAAL